MQTWNALFDIVLHDEQMARRLALQQDILDGVPQNAIGMAINQVIIMVMQEEWDKSIQAITDMEIFNDPDVGRAIMASQYANLAAEQSTNEASLAEPDEENKMETAFNDCIFKIKKQLIDESIAQKQSLLATEPDAEKRRLLQSELARLIMRKTRLKNERTTTR